MTVKRFVGATARECLKRVKAELGPEAVVLSNKQVEGGVEVVAMSPDSLDALSAQVAPGGGAGSAAPAAPTAPPSATPVASADAADSDYTVSLSAARRKAPEVRTWSPYEMAQRLGAAAPGAQAGQGGQASFGDSSRAPVVKGPAAMPGAHGVHGAQSGHGTEDGRMHGGESRPKLRPLPPKTPPDADVLSPPQVAATLQTAVKEAEGVSFSSADSAKVDGLVDEMRLIKSLLERQLSGFAFSEMARAQPVRALLLGQMIEAGFSAQLARRLVQEMPESLSQEDGHKWLKAAVNRRLRTLPAEADFIDRGGVYAVVGPTGVGKTTTTAKLAARCVVRYGADRLALLTTDGYRIGAQEQLRIYGRILNVPVFVVRDGDDLRRTLADLRDKHMVLIDTVGMSQRDRMVAEQAAMLTRSGRVNRLLLLNAGNRGDTLDDVIRAYGGEELAGCILTKVDEAPALAPALDCIVRHGLNLAYVANGQRVPEDLHLPNRAYLLHRAFKLPGENSPYRLKAEEIGLSLSAAKPDALTGASLA